MGEAQGTNGYQHEQSGHGIRIPRRRFLQIAGTSTAALLGAHSVMAGRLPGSGAVQSADALGPDAIDTLAGALDFDLERIFRFVADEIWYEPYGGLLRGASGTLESRAGNSVDKSVLLDALLRASFLDTRFVEGALDPAAESTILDSVVVTRDVARTRAAAVVIDPPPGGTPRPAATGPLPPELQEIADLAPELSAAATAWIAEHLDANVATIVQALGDAGIELGTAAPALPVLERDRHVWLQVKQGSDWIDLDPTIAGSQPGTAAAEPAGEPVTALPDDLRHRIRIAVIADVISGDTLAQRPVLAHEVFADAIGTAPIVLLHEKPDGLKGLGITIGAALGGQATRAIRPSSTWATTSSWARRGSRCARATAASSARGRAAGRASPWRNGSTSRSPHRMGRPARCGGRCSTWWTRLHEPAASSMWRPSPSLGWCRSRRPNPTSSCRCGACGSCPARPARPASVGSMAWGIRTTRWPGWDSTPPSTTSPGMRQARCTRWTGVSAPSSTAPISPPTWSVRT